MASILDLLASGTPGTEDYYSNNPWYIGGATVLKNPLPEPKNATQGYLFPFLQNLIGGAAVSYGEKQATQQAFQDYAKNPLLNSLSSYSGTEVPSGWSPDVGRKDLLLGVMKQQDEAESKAKQNEIIQKFLLEHDPEIIAADAKAKALGEAQGKGTSKEDKEKAIDDLRKEFKDLPEVKQFSQVRKYVGIIDKAAKDPDSVSDQELVRYGILLIEPGLAVREGEAAAIAQSQSIPAALKGQLSNALSGGAKLGPDVRKGLINLAKRSYEGHKLGYDKAYNFYRNEAQTKGLNPDRVSYLGEAEPAIAILNAQPRYKASDLIAQGYKKTAQGWVK